MTEPTTIRDRVCTCLAEIGACMFEAVELRDEHWLAGDLNFDSIDSVDAVLSLEDEFEITIPDDDVERLHTVADVVAYITRRLEEAAK